MTSRMRRCRRVTFVLLFVGILLWLTGPSIACAIIRRQLQAMITERLDARFDIGNIIYRFPYGVSVIEASIVGKEPDGKPLELLRVPRLNLQLARLPMPGQPLVIQSLEILDPAVHVIRENSGISQTRLAKPEALAAASSPRTKLSDMFRLTHLSLRGGQIIYEDRTKPENRPLVWRNLNGNLETSRQSTGSYLYRLVVDNSPLATLDISGAANLDELHLAVEKCALSVNVDPNAKESSLPAEIQAILREWQVNGTLAIDLRANVPLTDLKGSSYRATLELNRASARVPEWGTGLDQFSVKVELADGFDAGTDSIRPNVGNRAPLVRIEKLEAVAGDARFDLHNLLAVADLSTMTWNLKGLEGHLDPGQSRENLPKAVRQRLEDLKVQGALDFALSGSGPLSSRDLRKFTGRLDLTSRNLVLQPPGLDAPLGDFTPTTIQLANGTMTVEALRGKCGTNLLYVKRATARIDELPARLRVTDLEGCLTFGPEQKYPPFIARELSLCKPVGPYFFGGTVAMDFQKGTDQLDYDLNVHTKRGFMTILDRQIAISGIDSNINVTPAAVLIHRFEAAALGGYASASGRVDLKGQPRYRVDTTFRNIDLKELGRSFTDPGQTPPSLSGRGLFKAKLTGIIPKGSEPAFQGLAGTGEFDITHGDFWQIPVMKMISDRVSTKETVTVGDAAGQFRIEGNRIHFDRVVATSPALGVDGSGDITMDGALDLKLIANVGGRWADRAGDLGDGGGVAVLANAVQKGFDTVSRQLLYEVEVTGTTAKPAAAVTLAPMLTRRMKWLMGAASDKSGNRTGLLDAMHKDQGVPTGTQGGNRELK